MLTGRSLQQRNERYSLDNNDKYSRPKIGAVKKWLQVVRVIQVVEEEAAADHVAAKNHVKKYKHFRHFKFEGL